MSVALLLTISQASRYACNSSGVSLVEFWGLEFAVEADASLEVIALTPSRRFWLCLLDFFCGFTWRVRESSEEDLEPLVRFLGLIS